MLNNKIFFSGLNCDDSIRVLLEGDYLNMENMRNGVSGLGYDKQLENIPSTTVVHNHGLPYTNLGIGTAVDYARKRLIRCVYNSNGLHRILAYDIPTDTNYIVLLSSQTEKGFNWSKSFRIDRNAKVIGDLLLYTDANNEPQCINIEAGIKLNQPSYVTSVAAYLTPIPYVVTTLIVRPPIYAPEVAKITDGGFQNNYLEEGAYQFNARYQYKDYRYSALSAFSFLIPAHATIETFNAIQVNLPFTEIVPDYVQAVEFCVRYGNLGKTGIIKTYDKSNFYDNLSIQLHNAGTTKLGFLFYDNIQPDILDDVTANTSFDNVALTARTIELARNRTFLGNLLKGYNTPSRTSLKCTGITYAIPLITDLYFKGGCAYDIGISFFDRHRRKCGLIVVHAADIPDTLWYNATYAKLLSWVLSNAEASTEIPDTAYYYQIHLGKNKTKAFFVETGYVTSSYVSKNNDGTLDYTVKSFSDSTYAIAVDISFLFALGVGYTFSENDIAILKLQSGVNRRLKVLGQDGNNVLLEKADLGVLDSAYTWDAQATNNVSPNTKLPVVLTSSFTETGITAQSNISGSGENASKIIDITDGNSKTFHISGTFVLRALSSSSGTISISAKIMETNFSISDFYKIVLAVRANPVDNEAYTLSFNTSLTVPTGWEVLGIQLTGDVNADLISGSLIISTSLGYNKIEIYTPKKVSVTEPQYEYGDVMDVTNPTLPNRQYSITSGTIKGDIFLASRSVNNIPSYIVEVMSPNDKVWKEWNTNQGWANYIDKIGQQQKIDDIDVSDTYIQGTKVNGLNKFQALNSKNIGGSSGSIQKLQLTNKQQEDGTVMLIIAEQETLSAYLSEVQLMAAARAGDVATINDIIGTINALKNTRGTINPSSVCEYNGLVFAYDAIHGTYWQYSDNGIVDISEFKLHRFWDRYSKKYVSLTSSQIEALCGFAYISTCADPSTGEVLITIPQVEQNVVTSGFNVGFARNLPSYSTLPSYTLSIQNRFDIYDGNAKTMIYNWKRNRWMGSYGWLPDCMEYVGDKLFGIKNGNLHLFNENTTSFNTVFGVQYPQRICFTANLPISVLKDLFDIAIEGNAVTPNFTVAYTELPNEQITDLVVNDYDAKEGVSYAKFYRDRLSPNTTGNVINKLMNGDVLKSETVMVMCEWSEYTSKLMINFINLGWEISQGHLQIIPKPR